MQKSFLAILILLLSVLELRCDDTSMRTGDSRQWSSFRGPSGRGFIENAHPPVSWDIESSTHIRWQFEIPGLGHSSPVIWNNKLFVTTACSEQGVDSLRAGLYGDIDEANDNHPIEFRVYCIDRNSGQQLWMRIAHKGIPKSRRHTKSSQANCTPATDGKHLVVHFGSEGMYCYDLDGNLLWYKDMGILNPGPYSDPGVEWGYASSPVIWKEKVIVQCDIPVHPFIAALDISNGKELWHTDRTGEVSTWCSPAVCNCNGISQVVANGYNKICGYDIQTGRERWQLHNGGDAPAPTPVVANNLIYLNSAHGPNSPIFVVRPEAKGDISLPNGKTSNASIVWSVRRGGAYMQTPLIYKGFLYNLQVNGQLTCFDALTGEVKYKQNLNEPFTASGIAANGNLYFSSENGNVFVVEAGSTFKLIAKNRLEEVIMATPALAGNAIYFRMQHRLVAVE